MKCLFLIDIQNGFISTNTEHVLGKINDLLTSNDWDFVLSTQFVNIQDSPYQKFIGWKRLTESPEIDVLDFVKKQSDVVITKHIYSALTDEVKEILSKKHIEEVYISGIDTDCCVLKTAIDLFEIGIRPLVLVNYCASNGGLQSHEAAITTLRRSIGPQQLITDM